MCVCVHIVFPFNMMNTHEGAVWHIFAMLQCKY